jgi:hypothetical protein
LPKVIIGDATMILSPPTIVVTLLPQIVTGWQATGRLVTLLP